MTIKNFQLNKTWSDWSKLIAAILVAMSHYATCVCINNDWSDSSFLRLWCQGGNLGVALFFFLSGYGLMESEKKQHLVFNAFVKRRYAKVYLPALMVSVAWVLVCLCYRTHYSPSSLWEVLYDMFWGFNDPVLWFVKILFGLYGVFYLFTLLRYRNSKVSSLAVLILGTLLIMFVARKAGFPFINVPLFTIGVLASLCKEKRVLAIPSGLMFVILLGLINVVAFLFTKESHVAHGVINCTFVCVVLIIMMLLPPPHRSPIQVDRNSFLNS